MRLLAVDTSTEACSAAYLDDERLVSRCEELGRGHADRILGMIDEVLGEAGVRLGQLQGLAVAQGPGAFTGVRIGIAAVQALAFGAALPVVPVTTLEALAYPLLRRGAIRVLACLDARMGEIYCGYFTADALRGVRLEGTLAVAPPADLVVPDGGATAVGRGFDAYPELRGLAGLQCDPASVRALPDAREVALLGRLRLRCGEGITAGALAPLYLRDKVALTEAERGRV